MDLTASDPTGAWARWRARTPDLHKRLVDLLKQDTAALDANRTSAGKRLLQSNGTPTGLQGWQILGLNLRINGPLFKSHPT